MKQTKNEQHQARAIHTAPAAQRDRLSHARRWAFAPLLLACAAIGCVTE